MHVKSPCCNWGLYRAVCGGIDTLGLSHYRAFDIWVCQILTIASYNSEGDWWGYMYIDRCIIVTCGKVRQPRKHTGFDRKMEQHKQQIYMHIITYVCS